MPIPTHHFPSASASCSLDLAALLVAVGRVALDRDGVDANLTGVRQAHVPDGTAGCYPWTDP